MIGSGLNKFSGRVHTVIYENSAQAFYILKMVMDGDTKPITIRGNVPGLPIKTGSWFGFEGKWVNHDQYGRQIQITRAPILDSTLDADTVSRMLVSNGIGEVMVDRLRSHFGDAFVDAVSDEALLEKAPGMTKFTAKHLVSRWKSAQAHFRTLSFLGELNLPKGKVSKIWSEFGDKAEEILSTNPWELVRIDGIQFHHLDEIAQKLSLPLSGSNRVRGAVLYVCKSRKGLGHLYTTSSTLISQVRSLVPDAETRVIGEALASLHKDNLLVVDRTTEPGTTAIYEPWFHKVEEDSARMLRERIDASKHFDVDEYLEKLSSVGPKTMAAVDNKESLEDVALTAVQEWGSQSKVELSDDQTLGVTNALIEPISIITGLPGTGKTTSLRILVRVLQSSGVPFLLLAPTGIAAKRLGAVTGAKAYTIHRAFAAKGHTDDGRTSTYEGVVGESNATIKSDGDEDWGFTPDNPHPAKFIVVDEASMVDQALLYRLLKCTSVTSRLLFVGDAAQLPSVGPGNVLRDLITSDNFSMVHLTDIFRQEDTSDIVYAAHEVYAGRTPEFTSKSDFTLLEEGDEDKALEVILQLAERMYNRRDNFQILSPRHSGTLGVTNLNSRLRDLLNPKKPGGQEMILGRDYGTIREDDRIMVVKNNYELGIYNGDVGKVSRIDRKAQTVEIKIHGTPPMIVPISFKEVPTYLRLAYAMTVHKSQGQEYDRILMPVVPSFRHQLQRNLLYTGITRAKEKVVLIGRQTALTTAIENNKEDHRNTLFIHRLAKVFS